MSTDSGARAITAALAANLGIAAAKFVAFAFTGSTSMLAEGVHSVADSGNQALLIIGRVRSERRTTPEHPFGYGRERYFYAFLVAVVLFTVGSLFSLYEGWHKIRNPHPVTDPVWAFGVLVFAIVLEGFSFSTAIRESNPQRGSRTWLAFIRRAKAPELPVVLLEDSAALIGLILAMAGIAISVITGDGVWDGAGSMAIGLLLGFVAIVLAVETKSLLIGESAHPDVQRRIIEALEAGDEVERVIHLRTQHIGPEELLVAAKIAVRHDETAAEIARGIDAAEKRIRAAVPMAHFIYLEPDLYSAPKATRAGAEPEPQVIPPGATPPGATSPDS